MAEWFGKPSEVLVVKDIEKPKLEPTEVMVKVEAATVNKNDTFAPRTVAVSASGISGVYSASFGPPEHPTLV